MNLSSVSLLYPPESAKRTPPPEGAERLAPLSAAPPVVYAE
jgi:hypothetical protein